VEATPSFPGFRSEAPREATRDRYAREEFREAPVAPRRDATSMAFEETGHDEQAGFETFGQAMARTIPTPAAGSYVPAAASESRPELVAVPASVFDDDFFRKPNNELRGETSNPPVREAMAAPSTATASPAAPAAASQWPEARIPSFAGYAGEAAASESDELDIPAFLRRNQ
jgi:cell division protein FtsZ